MSARGKWLVVICLAGQAALLGGCSSGQSSPDAGVIVSCDAGCTDVQRCDPTQDPPVCTEICKPPKGCRPDEDNPLRAYGYPFEFEKCNTATAQCDPVTCADGGQCQAGETCINWGLGEFKQSAPCSCIPAGLLGADGVTRTTDSCAYEGKICDFDHAKRSGRCRMPLLGEPCVEAAGCDPAGAGADTGLECVDGACQQYCTDSSECRDSLAACVAGGNGAHDRHCMTNWCLDPSGVLSTHTDRSGYFQPCDSSGTGDGTCIPVVVESGGEYFDVGACLQAGSLAPGIDPQAVCDPSSGRHSADKTCIPGYYCQTADLDSASSAGAYRGFCRPMCNAGLQAVSVTSCPEGESCSDLSGLGESGVSDSVVAQARSGVCLDECDVFDPKCPLDPLGNPQACGPDYHLDAAGFCQSIVIEAPLDYGSWCDPYVGAVCADGLICAGSTTYPPSCNHLCDLDECPPNGRACAACTPNTCVPCTPDCEGRVCGEDPDGCGGTCQVGQGCLCGGEICSVATQEVCYQNACCAHGAHCAGKECGSDGCGGTCGSCPGSKVCQADGSCCIPNCVGNSCGDPDGCGGTCQGCPLGQVCYSGSCCTPNCESAKSCGDPDGCGGGCPGPCAQSGTICYENQCCKPSCFDHQCGPDGCGGKCGDGCDGAVCLSSGYCCTPNCDHRECGDNGCGGRCGTCPEGNICREDKEPESCPNVSCHALGPARNGAFVGACAPNVPPK
jgi:hypothetical protein